MPVLDQHVPEPNDTGRGIIRQNCPGRGSHPRPGFFYAFTMPVYRAVG